MHQSYLNKLVFGIKIAKINNLAKNAPRGNFWVLSGG
jgi:hypothetical protein